MGSSSSNLERDIEEIHYATFRVVKKPKKSSNKQKSSKSSSKQRSRKVHPTTQSSRVEQHESARIEEHESARIEEHESSMVMESSSNYYSDTMIQASKKVDKNIWSAAEQLLEAVTSMKRHPTKMKLDSEIASVESNSSKKLLQLPRWVPEPSPPYSSNSPSPLNSARVDSLTGVITLPASSLSIPELHGHGLTLSPMHSAKNSPLQTPSVSRRGSKKN